MAGVREAQVALPDVEPPSERGDEQRRATLVDEDPVRALERLGRAGRVVDRGVQQRPDERHQQCRGDALAGHVRDHHAQRAAAATQPEEVEEVATDLARGLVVSGNVIARHVRWRERYEAALEAPAVGQLLLEPPGVRGVLGRDRQVGHGRRRERGRERFGHGRPEAAGGRLAPDPDPAADERAGGDLARNGVASRSLERGARDRRSVGAFDRQAQARLERAERRDDRVEIELDRDLGRHRRAGAAIMQGRWPRRSPRIGPHGRRTFDRDRFA